VNTLWIGREKEWLLPALNKVRSRLCHSTA